MSPNEINFLIDVWAFDKTGRKVYPYKGQRGEKKGLFSVNFTNDTNNYEGLTESELIDAIVSGKFKTRGTIRMLAINIKLGEDRNAFAPLYYLGKPIKDL